MGFLDFIFGKKDHPSQQPRRRRSVSSIGSQDQNAVLTSAQSILRVVNESLQIIEKTKNPQTAESRIRVAKEKLAALKDLRDQFEFLRIDDLDRVELDLARLEMQWTMEQFQGSASGNMQGQALEKAGDIAGALKVYEALAVERVDTPHTYQRLAILYRKAKRRDDEIRALQIGIEAIPESNPKHLQWLEDRLAKLESRP